MGTTAVTIVNNVIIRELEFGGERQTFLSVPNISISAKTALNPGSSVPAEVAGLLGSDTLARFDVDLDFGKRQMTLYRVRGCRTVKPEWTGAYSSVPITTAPFRPMTIPVELNGRKANAIFDTGAMQSAVTKASAIKLGVKPEDLAKATKQIYYGVGEVAAKLANYQFKTVKVGEETLNDMRLTVLELPLWNADMLLGMDYMAGGRFFISNATRTLYLQPASRSRVSVQAEFDAAARRWTGVGGLGRYYGAGSPPKCGAGEAYALNRCMKVPDNGAARPLTAPAKPASVAPPAVIGPKVEYAQMRDLSRAALAEIGLNQSRAMLVVLPHGAEASGLRSGDVVLAVEGNPPDSSSFIRESTGNVAAGTAKTFTVLRNFKRVDVTVTAAVPTDVQKPEYATKDADTHIKAEREIAAIFTKDTYPNVWVTTQMRLGWLYTYKKEGERSSNIEAAIEANMAALSFLTREKEAKGWADTQFYLGRAYWHRVAGTKKINLEYALEAFENALGVLGAKGTQIPEAFKADWSLASAWQGQVYLARSLGDRADNVEKAVEALNAAFAVSTAKMTVEDKAWLHDQLGHAYRSRLRGDRGENIEKALQEHQAALALWDAKAAPLQWARSQRDLGLAYESRTAGAERENYEKAAQAYTAALTVLTDKNAEYWAIQKMLPRVQNRS